MVARGKYYRIQICSENTDKPLAMIMDILKRPILGHYVRKADSTRPLSNRYTSANTDNKEVKFQRDLSSEEIGLVRKALRTGGFTSLQEDRVVNMLMTKRAKVHGRNVGSDAFIIQALVTILIVVSPNIVTMKVDQPRGRSYDNIMDFPLVKLLRQANASPENKSYLRNLRSLHLSETTVPHYAGFHFSLDFERCLRLFDTLPSIESVRSHGDKEGDDGKLEFKEKSSNISKISLSYTAASSLYFANLIWSCKVLTNFTARMCGSVSIVSPKAFIKALCAHKKTLEILDVSLTYEIDPFDEEDIGGGEAGDDHFNRHGGPFERGIRDAEREFYQLIWTQAGSLKEFVALKRVSLDIDFLLYFAAGVRSGPYKERKRFRLVNCLPPGLEYLCVRKYQAGYNKEHDGHIGRLPKRPRKLKEIKITDEFM
ncbi:uncharacterized protein N7518_009683 [Penicillium psychrosexuale]|uniref:uncharacterized protein n=1 Tax=Penicillium psychrosexuale TaxID=1002107 RepID=UPI0025454E45|nr:uncharacterized protein N7518_009683 [Penicillium psychrosexuale]KAJ5784006.1 hypothetical protein N7518_009683 [Penicillium psychrosexuale]